MNCVKPVYIIGDIHDVFGRLKKKVEYFDLRGCYLICVGDLGIGFNYSSEDEISNCNDLNKFFADRDVSFMSIRGNHDDPAFFGGCCAINLSHFKLLPDYHAEILNGERFLFVGGAVSVDRRRRAEGLSWWRDEKFQYMPERVYECDVLITHTAPSWNSPFDKNGIASWCNADLTLWDECYKERVDTNALIVQCGAKKHYCGHFHKSQWAENDGCYSTILNIEEIKEHRQYEKSNKTN
jgi:hypothetical protein